MTLKLYYKENDSYVEVSSGNDSSQPITSVHNGKTGDVVSDQLFIRNDNINAWYSNIVISSYDSTTAPGKDDTDYDSTGWGIKLSDGEEEPTSSEWNNIQWANSIDMEDIGEPGQGDSTTYFPFWRLITCPPHTDIQIKKNIFIRAEYTENVV